MILINIQYAVILLKGSRNWRFDVGVKSALSITINKCQQRNIVDDDNYTMLKDSIRKIIFQQTRSKLFKTGQNYKYGKNEC